MLTLDDLALHLDSHTDLTFCLATPFASVSSTAQRSSTKPSRLKHSRPGTAIFIFNLKTRTRATDWMWEIYLLLKTSSALPRFLDIHVPDLNNARIRIKVPVVGETRGVDSTEAVVRAMTRDKILQQSVEVLKELEGWKRLMGEMGVTEGEVGDWEAVKRSVALAWRKRDRLDWVWTDVDVTGHRREWNVLVGSGPLKQVRRRLGSVFRDVLRARLISVLSHRSCGCRPCSSSVSLATTTPPFGSNPACASTSLPPSRAT